MRPVNRLIPGLTSVLLLMAGCGGGGTTDPVAAAQAKVSSAEREVAEAQSAFDQARQGFCQSSKSYIAAVDRYGKGLDDTAATVGDVKTAGADLAKPREAAEADAKAVVAAGESLEGATEQLTVAQNELAAAQSGTSSTRPTTSTGPTTTTTLVPTATVDRVKKAEADLTAASAGINDQTPVLQATAKFNSAAFALEVAWLRLFTDAGCFTDEQGVKAATAMIEYTTALQTALKTAGYYPGEVDGLYGPSTVEAVENLQKANGLPVTGLVDQATDAALTAAVASKGGAVAAQAAAHTSAVQSTLKLAGYWTGPVDGKWTPELTAALQTFQTALGVPATGAVDAATLNALQKTIQQAQAPATPTTTTAATTTTRAAATTTAG
jgi:peptidoglycan hydrolase-like protein with peptidoglycan-binding domain